MKRLLLINILLIIVIIKVPLKAEVIETAKEEIKETTQEVKEEIIKANPTTRTEETKREKVIPTKTSEQGIKLIKKYEGCKLTAYKLPNEKYYTIGYGHYGADVKAGQQITQAQAENLLKNDLQRFEGHITSRCKRLDLTQNEFDALVSFTFNCGEGNLNKLTNNRNKEQIANKLVNYTNSGSIRNKQGLQKRRNEEQKLFLGGNI